MSERSDLRDAIGTLRRFRGETFQYVQRLDEALRLMEELIASEQWGAEGE